MAEDGTHITGWGSVTQRAANADRIVACVNACEGINPKAIPDLLAALEAVEWVQMPDGFGGLETEPTCPWCDGYPLDDEEKAAGLIEHKPDCQRQAAIAAAKGEMDG